MALRQHKASQIRAEMSADAGRQRRYHRAPVGGQPALAAIAEHPRPDLQLLHHIILVAFETGTGRHRDRDHLLFDRNSGLVAPPASARMGRLGQTRLFHAARFAGLEPRSSFQPLQPGNLGALIVDHPLQLGDVAHQADDQRLQLGWRQIVETSGRRYAVTKPEIAYVESPDLSIFTRAVAPCPPTAADSKTSDARTFAPITHDRHNPLLDQAMGQLTPNKMSILSRVCYSAS